MAEPFYADPSHAAEVVRDGSADELATLDRQLPVDFSLREFNSAS